MVSFTSLALLSLAAIGSIAAPAEKRWSNSKCMTAAEAQQVADNYAELIRAYSTDLANAALAVDFTDYSESVNSLINTCPQGSAAVTLPLLSPSFSNRTAFETGQGQQPAINFKQLNLEYNCNFITLRWETTNTAPIPTPRPVVGIILILAEPAPSGNKYPWVVKNVYSEFDSAAWLQNLEQAGICTATASGSPQLPLPSGTVGPAPPASASAAPTTASVAPASASGYTTSAVVSASTYPSASDTASSYATSSSYAASSATASSYATSSAAPSYAASYSAAVSSAAVTYSA